VREAWIIYEFKNPNQKLDLEVTEHIREWGKTGEDPWTNYYRLKV